MRPLVALAAVAAGLLVPSASSAPISAGMSVAADQRSDVIQVHDTKPKRKTKRRAYEDDDFGYGINFIPGHVLTPYGYRDCIGKWHRHRSGRMHCHGQLIRD